MRFFLLVSIGLAIHFISFSQLINIESQRMQTDSIRFAGNGNLVGNYQKNNGAEFYQISSSVSYQIKSKSLKDTYLLLGSYEWAKFGKSNITNKGFGHLRYNRKMKSWLKFEVYSQYQANEILGLRSRFLNGTGFRFKIINSKLIKSYLGTSCFYELEHTVSPENKLNKGIRASIYGVFSIKFPKDKGELNWISYYQPILSNVKDYRISSQFNLIFNLNKKWAFTSGLNLLYDTNPPEGILRDAFNFQNGIRFSL
jgi:hypothetical protein